MNFDENIMRLNSEKNYMGILKFLLTMQSELLALPISHKTHQLTIQRFILLILPLIKNQEKASQGKPKVYDELKNVTL